MTNKNKSNNRCFFGRLAVRRKSHPGIWRSIFTLPCLGILAGLMLAVSPAWAEIKEGDILVVDQYGSGTDNHGTLMKIDPATGQRTILSDFGNPKQGRLGSHLRSVVVDADGWIYATVSRGGVGVLFEIDPDNGNRTDISNFGQGNIQGSPYYGLDVDKTSQLLLNNHHSIVRINPDNDTRTIVTSLNNPAHGAIETDPKRFITDLVVERSGTIIIGTARSSGWELGLDSAIFRVDPVSGKRTLLSDFSNPSQGADLVDLWNNAGLAIEASGNILAASNYERSLLLRINPRSGKRTVLSDFDNTEQGDTGSWLHGVAIEKRGTILVLAGLPYTDGYAVHRVNRRTGQRVMVSNSDESTQGPLINAGTYIAVVPKIRKRGRHH